MHQVVCKSQEGQPSDVKVQSHVFLSGSHCVVSVGQSKAVLRIKSYRYGEFFFHILYSGDPLIVDSPQAAD